VVLSEPAGSKPGFPAKELDEVGGFVKSQFVGDLGNRPTGVFADKPTSFYDLFRVQSGKIAEHWDTMETIAARAEWKNANGKFGF
jgi:hypothetical protein